LDETTVVPDLLQQMYLFFQSRDSRIIGKRPPKPAAGYRQALRSKTVTGLAAAFRKNKPRLLVAF
jgi:hypothetical protein